MSDHPAITDPQRLARAVLSTDAEEIADRITVELTDGDDTGRHGSTLRVNPGQIEAGAEQYRLSTGESVDADALTSALPWSPPWD
ncbi:MAG: hypothetical protein QM809_18290 [Gordonia sp. (in: high G+C Gram-positive bacteria)]|uniref:hypothetical protein n=1 Tax=Gordonia sp. (in: high G+C Gram-positive bacteria) TaxID=84139 RepID=UPI0039E46C74